MEFKEFEPRFKSATELFYPENVKIYQNNKKFFRKKIAFKFPNFKNQSIKFLVHRILALFLKLLL